VFPSLNAPYIGIDASLPEVIRLARDHGFEGVDLDIAEVEELASEHGLDFVRCLFDDAGVRPSSWQLPFKLSAGRSKWEAGLARLPRHAQMAAGLGCRRAVVSMQPGSDERPYDENFRFHVERIGLVAETLKAYGAHFGIEFLGTATLRRTYKYEFIHTIYGLFELIASIGADNVGVLLDSYHWHTSSGTAATFDRLKNEDLVLVHLNDGVPGVPLDEMEDLVRPLPGESGGIDLVTFLLGLTRIDYDGPMSVEPFSERLKAMAPDDAAEATIESLRRIGAVAGAS